MSFFHGRKNFIKDKFFWTNSIIFEDRIVKSKFSNKKICVIIPARNEEKYIEETLLSIKNQNISSLHTLVINDNSTDNTQQVLKKFKKLQKLKNFTWSKTPTRLGWKSLGTKTRS